MILKGVSKLPYSLKISKRVCLHTLFLFFNPSFYHFFILTSVYTIDY